MDDLRLAWVPLALVLSLSLPLAASGEEEKHPVPFPIPDEFAGFALGYDIPLRTRNGRGVPIIYSLYSRWEEGVDPWAFSAELATSTLTIRSSHLLGPGIFATLEGKGTFLSHNAAPYFYDRGRFDPDRSINQTFLGGQTELSFKPWPLLTVSVYTGAHRFSFYKYDGASPFHTPPDTMQICAGASLCFKNLRYYDKFRRKDGWLLDLDAEFFCRQTWGPWGTEAETRTDWRKAKDWGWLRGHFGIYLLPEADLNLLLDLRTGIVFEGDRLSAIRVGSLVGDIPLAGAAYGELAVDRYAFLRVEAHKDLWPGGNVAIGFDVGLFHVLYGSTRTVYGFYVCVTQRTIMGMPVSLTYGYCPEALRPGINGGHELMLMAKAAFW